MIVRLQKYLADAGICSRRKAETLILEGKVTVNNTIITELGTKVDTQKDSVCYDGIKVSIKDKNVYIILNKPIEYITTVKDQFGRLTVMDLIKDIEYRLVPVGRLDYDTSGLLIMTNDGDLVYKITHPKHNINKVYIAQIKGIPTQQEISDFEKGLFIDDYKTSDAKFEILKTENNHATVKITIHEGKNRQVRKMCDKIGHPVISLTRVAIGDIELGQLAVGEYRYLTDDEINYLKKI